MSRPCAIPDCKRVSRALCYCCQQDLCRDHLNEHDDALNHRLNPIADDINMLKDRLNNIQTRNLFTTIHQQLDQWRNESHHRIDGYYEQKQRELVEYMTTKIHAQTEAIDRLRAMIKQLIDKQETTMEDLNTISSAMESIQRDITQIERKSVDLNINPLEIDDKLIDIDDERTKQDINLLILTPPIHTINRLADSHKPVVSNNRNVLIHRDNQLCLLNRDLTVIKSIPWPHAWIWDMCWSSVISRFFIITLTEIFTLDERTMALEQIIAKDKYSFSACTCSHTSLYITTNEIGSSIYEYSLFPKIEFIRQWQPIDLCQKNELIQDIVFHKSTFAFIIENQATMTKRMELRVAQTFEKLWSLQFDIVDALHNAYRLCPFNYNEWIVIDWKSAQLFHITQDGQIKSACTYESVPYRCCQFGSNLLAISAKNSINFHQI